MHDGAVLGQHHERTLVLAGRRPLFARLDSLIARLLLMADLPSQPAASKQHNRGCYLPVSPSLASEVLLNRLAEPLLLNFLHLLHAASPPPTSYALCGSRKSGSSLSKADRSTASPGNFALNRHQTLHELLTSTQKQPKGPRSCYQPRSSGFLERVCPTAPYVCPGPRCRWPQRLEPPREARLRLCRGSALGSRLHDSSTAG